MLRGQEGTKGLRAFESKNRGEESERKAAAGWATKGGKF